MSGLSVSGIAGLAGAANNAYAQMQNAYDQFQIGQQGIGGQQGLNAQLQGIGGVTQSVPPQHPATTEKTVYEEIPSWYSYIGEACQSIASFLGFYCERGNGHWYVFRRRVKILGSTTKVTQYGYIEDGPVELKWNWCRACWVSYQLEQTNR